MPAVKSKKPAPRKAAPAKKKVAPKKSGNWFERMTPMAQRSYIKAHPNSIYAKGAKAGKKAAAAKAPRKSARAVEMEESSAAAKFTAAIADSKRKIESARESLKQNRGTAPYMARNRMLLTSEIHFYKNEIKELTKKRAEQRKTDRKKK